MNKYRIYEFVIKDDNIYPNGMCVYLANDRDGDSILEDDGDEKIYHYVDDDIDLSKICVGDTIMLDEEFIVIGGADANKRKGEK